MSNSCCYNCMFYPTLPVTFVGEAPNLCQKGLNKNLVVDCPYFCRSSNLINNDYYHRTFKSINFKQ